MLDQAHSAAALAHRASAELDYLLAQHAGSHAGVAERVLQPLDRALSGWTRVNAGLAEQLTPTVAAWDSEDPPTGDELRQLVDQGSSRYLLMMENACDAVATLSKATPVVENSGHNVR